VHDVHELVTNGDLDAAHQELPVERAYPLPGSLGTDIGADHLEPRMQQDPTSYF
jgi:hypothetical protein